MTWTDPDGAPVSTTDIANYELIPGTVDGTGKQEAVLRIKVAKLGTLTGTVSETYKCSVKSSRYVGSPASPETDVVADIQTLTGSLSAV